MKMRATRYRQKGVTMVEFSIIGLLFFILMFGVLEFSRLLFTWNAVADAARLGARAASVCVVDSTDIKKIALSDPTGTGNAFLPNDITTANIQVRYLNTNGAQIAVTDPVSTTTFMQIRYVQVSITNYQFQLNIPLVGGSITLPPFTTTRPREALGVLPIPTGSTAPTSGC